MEKKDLPIQIQWLLSMPLQIFKISLICGTFLFILFSAFHYMFIAIIGYYYLLLAAAINVFALALLIAFSFIERKYQKQLLIKTSVMLINIPIAILFYYMIFSH